MMGGDTSAAIASSGAASRVLELPHGNLALPAFLPDATSGVIRSVDFEDVRRCGVPAVVMNTFHLMQRPGSSTIRALGGLHRMTGWEGPIVTDSGGFQAYSVVRENPRLGHVDDRGITFRSGEEQRKFQLTPEKCVQLQMAYDTDVVICLDECTHVDDPFEVQQASVERTIAWARRCKREYLHLLAQRKLSPKQRPWIFGVVQGGPYRELRERCATALLEIGFDGFGYGGWPLDRQGNLLTEHLGITRELIPRRYPVHALGVGHPENVLACHRLGYEIFDSALPTRDARHGRLFTFTGPASGEDAGLRGKWLASVHPQDSKHIKSRDPISPLCDCLTCTTYSLGYLHHLFKLNDNLYPRLATIHNLRFMSQLTARLAVLPPG
jgi:queuine tRNA-ribosyltransferase